jgi:hypothetical protein
MKTKKDSVGKLIKDVDEVFKDRQIREEVDGYLAINGEKGAWGEPMRDQVGVDAICETLADGGVEITDEIRARVEKYLLNDHKCIECGVELPDSETGYCYKCNEKIK